MQKQFIVLVAFLFILLDALCQVKEPVVVNKKIEVVDYDYEYLFVEFLSETRVATFLPIYGALSESVQQTYFESGRSSRPGLQIEFLQSLKIENWALGIGLGYNGLFEQFSYADYPLKDITVQNADGTMQTVTVAYGVPEVKSNVNQLHYLSLPLQLSYYKHLLKNDFRFSVGLSFDRLLALDYWVKFSSNESLHQSSASNFNNAVVNLKLSADILRPIGENICLHFQPFYKFPFNAIIDTDVMSYDVSSVGVSIICSIKY